MTTSNLKLVASTPSRPPWVRLFGELASEEGCDFVAVIDVDRTLISASAGWSRVFGEAWTWREGENLAGVVPAPLAAPAWAEWRALVESALAADAPLTLPVAWAGIQQGILRLELACHPLRDGLDRVIGVIVRGRRVAAEPAAGRDPAPPPLMPAKDISAWVLLRADAADPHRPLRVVGASLYATRSLTGRVEPMTGLEFLPLVAPASAREMEIALARALQTGEPSVVEFELAAAGGQEAPRPVLQAFVARRDAQHLRVLLHDQTARRLGQQMAGLYRRRVETLLAHGHDLIATVGAKGTFTYLNRAPEGLGLDAVLGRNPLALVVPAQRAMVRAMADRVRAGGEPAAFECSTRRPAGRHFLVRLARLGGGGPPDELVIAAIDITAARQAAESSRRLAALVAHSPDGIIGAGRDGRITDWNGGAERIFGYAAAEAVGRPLLDLVPADQRAREQTAFAAALAGESTPASEGERLRRDGTLVPVNAAVFPHRGEAGRVTGVTQVVRDLAPLRTLEAQLERAQRLASQGQLAAAAAHEISNSLTLVLGHAALLAEKGDEEVRRRLAPIVQAATVASRMSNQLRDLSRPLAAELRPVDLADVLRSAFRMLEHVVPRELRLELAEPSGLRVSADPLHLDVILINLVLNARDATRTDGRVILRAGRAPAPPGRLYLEVEDNGCGLTAEVQTEAFKGFFTTKPPGRGTGLGLATVLRLTKEMGGELDIASAPGQGTRVRLTLPAA